LTQKKAKKTDGAFRRTDRARTSTGLDPSDPKNDAKGILWAVDDIKKAGWQHYHGAANGAHLSNWAGIDRGGGGNSNVTTINVGPSPSQFGDIGFDGTY
jgi:hypothetical protein